MTRSLLDPILKDGAPDGIDATAFRLWSGPLLVGATFRSPAQGRATPPTEVGGSKMGSRAFQCAGLYPSVAVRMAVLYLLARGR